MPAQDRRGHDRKTLRKAKEQAQAVEQQDATDLRIVLEKLLPQAAENAGGDLRMLASVVAGVRATVVQSLRHGVIASLAVGELPVEVYVPDTVLNGLPFAPSSPGEEVWVRPLTNGSLGFDPMLVLEHVPPGEEPVEPLPEVRVKQRESTRTIDRGLAPGASPSPTDQLWYPDGHGHAGQGWGVALGQTQDPDEDLSTIRRPE
jgi:hypothetical protein